MSVLSLLKRKPQPIDGGRKFKDDAERRRVMLERAKPVTSPEEQIAILEKQVEAMKVDALHFAQLRADMERVVLFIRENYSHEIDRKEPQHQGSAVDAILHYAKIERAYRRSGVPLPS